MTKKLLLFLSIFILSFETANAISTVNSATLVDPVIITRITDQETIKMPSLMAYPLFASATPDAGETITSITFMVDGIDIPAMPINNAYRANWTPISYGAHVITITANSSGGGATTIVKNVTVSNDTSSASKQTFQNNVINFDGSGDSRWFYETYTLPQFVGAYNSVVANFSTSCPNVAGGCDDWDRLAWVQVKNPSGQWIELFRYITPYGVGCSHSIDVTDYESVLQGVVEFRMFIDTWGSGGWNLNLNLVYNQGTPAFNYSSVEEVWQGDYNFGDMANLQPVPVKNIVVPQNTSDIKFRLVTTGHGWGENNTGNAAEFYNGLHNLKVNGANTFTQQLWTVCNPNPDNCTGQAGTWQYNRAGWCPGTIADPYFYNLNPYISLGSFNFQYQFKTTYKDFCNASNPNCVNGTTCPNCNDGYNPFYRVGAYMIYRGNLPVQSLAKPQFTVAENSITVYPNTTKGIFNIELQKSLENFVVEIYSISGQSLKNYHFKDQDQLNDYTFDVTGISKGTYFVKIYDINNNYVSKLVVE